MSASLCWGGGGGGGGWGVAGGPAVCSSLEGQEERDCRGPHPHCTGLTEAWLCEPNDMQDPLCCMN